MKALALLSGGLDSRLVTKILQEQLGENKVEALFFILPFEGSCCSDKYCVFKFAQKHNVKLNILDCSRGELFDEYMQIIRSPKYSRGRALNPCIDCHLFMLKKAKELAKKIKAEIIATGEVLGERPLSQRKTIMLKMEKEAGVEGKVLRPLSAKLLPETEAEKKGLIDREKLFSIQGKSRKKQIELAGKYGINYPNPAGGCPLTNRGFSDKVRDLFQHQEKISAKDIQLLKIGRHFRSGNCKIIVGRNEEENKKLLEMKDKNDWVVEVPDVGSPVTILKGEKKKGALRAAARLTAHYSDAREDKVKVKYGKEGERKITIKKPRKEGIDRVRISRGE